MEKSPSPLVNVRAVIRAKSPSLERYLPSFVIRYLERILHQDELNEILTLYGHLPGVPMSVSTLEHLRIQSQPIGLEHIPSDGRYIFMSNHPLGGLDGLVLIKTIGQQFPNVKFIVNDLLLFLKPFEDVFVPVNKHGRQSSDYAQRIIDTYDSDAQILYFPAGLCSRKIKGQITDLPWKRNVLQKAIKHQRDIVPVYFSGANSNFFYRLANIRKRLGLKFNIEMLYLSDEVFRQKGNNFTLYFGQPIPYTRFTAQKSLDAWLQDVRREVYALPHTYTNR
jgi:Putative hemolysin